MSTTDTLRTTNRFKLAQVTSATGALILGVAIGTWLGDNLQQNILVILLAGIAVHGWGMYDLHRLDTSASGPQPRWVTALYWLCWLLLALLVGWVLLRLR